MKHTPMKTFPALFISLIAFAASTFAAGMDYKITKITPALVKTPQIQFQGEQRRTPPMQQQWLEVEVEFQVQPDITDEVTFKYFIWVGDKVLSGEVTHVEVAKGRGLMSVVYVAPKIVQKLAGGKTVNITAVQNVGVQIFVKGQQVDELSWKPAPAQWWQSMSPVSGLVLNKSETPFSALYWDRYEALKPTTH